MKDTRVATGIQTYTFTDEDDHVFASFRLNPTDINLAKRALEVGEYFEHLKDIEPKTVEELARMNDAMEQKISYVLGYEASDIFGEVTATTVFQDGTIFAILVVDTIIEAVQPALQERAKSIQEKSAKYLEKYE